MAKKVISNSTDTPGYTWDDVKRDLNLNYDELYLSVVNAAVQALLDNKAASLGADDNYVTNTEKVVIGNTLGANSGDQDISDLTDKTANETIVGDWIFNNLAIGSIFINANLTVNNTYSSSSGLILNAGETTPRWAILTPDATTGELMLANAGTAGRWPAWGIGITAGSDGNALSIVQKAAVRFETWNWTPKAELFLNSTSGELTQTAPSTTGYCIQSVGRAITSNIVLFDIDPGKYMESA